MFILFNRMNLPALSVAGAALFALGTYGLRENIPKPNLPDMPVQMIAYLPDDSFEIEVFLEPTGSLRWPASFLARDLDGSTRITRDLSACRTLEARGLVVRKAL